MKKSNVQDPPLEICMTKHFSLLAVLWQENLVDLWRIWTSSFYHEGEQIITISHCFGELFQLIQSKTVQKMQELHQSLEMRDSSMQIWFSLCIYSSLNFLEMIQYIKIQWLRQNEHSCEHSHPCLKGQGQSKEEETGMRGKWWR